MQVNAGFLVFLIVISVLNSAAQVVMRWGGALASAAPKNPSASQWISASRWWIVGLALSWICGLGWAVCLRKIPLSLGLPIYSGLVYVLSALLGVWLLRERLSALQIAGVLLILLGIFFLMPPFQAQPKI